MFLIPSECFTLKFLLSLKEQSLSKNPDIMIIEKLYEVLLLPLICLKSLLSNAGADLGFSRGWGRIFRKISKFYRPLFRSTKLIFLSSPRALKSPCFGENFCTAGKNLKKQAIKAF